MSSIEINPQFVQVLEFVNRTSRCIFLTGKAGTGKTTLLKHIRGTTYKQMAVCAPTGVAAINAGGSTIHSFFQFPFSPFIPRVKENGDIDASAANLPTLKYNAQRLAIFRSLELLVIDEISMVRADLLDQIDITLRYTRKKWHLPFGGVQLLLIGDMHQLPPVVKPDEWQLLQPHYKSLFFFDSHVITRHPPVYVELDKVYRQSDDTFINLLNKVRHGELDADALAVLDARYKPKLTEREQAKSITLTTHNHKADEINSRNLAALAGRSFIYKAVVDRSFPEKNYPAPDAITLKIGARVMFLKNNYEKNYYNGKVGIVTDLDEKSVTVKCEEDKDPIRVNAVEWQNISYKVDRSTHHINEEVLGTFSQIPLRLAWAITIHKSQGLTFDRVIIDAAEAFSAGQVYVALSRCRSLEGLTLTSRIEKQTLYNDEQVLSFARDGKRDDQQLRSVLEESRAAHIRSVIDGLFDLNELAEARRELTSIAQQYDRRLSADASKWLTDFFILPDSLCAVSVKFRNQLAALANAAGDPEHDGPLQDRIKKAAAWFSGELDKLFLALKNCTLSVESKEAAMELNDVFQPLLEFVFARKELMAAMEDGFTFEGYVKKKLQIVYPPARINVYATAGNTRVDKEVKHPVLFRKLLFARDEICKEEELPVYMVANSKSVTELAKYMPVSMDELLCISGFGKARAEAFGDRFLSIIRAYREEHNIAEAEIQFPKKKKRREKEKQAKGVEAAEDVENKPPSLMRTNKTRELSFQLFRQGKSPQEIATERGLVPGTILSHLVPYVASGELEVGRLVSPEKQVLINAAMEDFLPEQGLGHLKSKLPEEITFSDLRFMLAYKEWQRMVLSEGK